jgi:hypothetical protein
MRRSEELSHKRALATAEGAVVAARYAYHYSPTSYTYDAFLEALRTRDRLLAVTGPDWIAEVEAYTEG